VSGFSRTRREKIVSIAPVISPEFRRALRYLVPYWRRLALVVVLSGLNTALTLTLPYLTKMLVDGALVDRNLRVLYTTVALFAAASIGGFALTAIVGLRYTKVSADVLFDMRLALYRHLQRLSPRFYSRTPLGDILARVNNDVSEIQRVAAESLLAWVGNMLFLVGSIAAMFWLDWRLALVGLSLVPIAVLVLARTRAALTGHIRVLRETSAAIGSFLIESVQAIRLVVASNAQEREVGRFSAANSAFVKALMSMQLWSYLSGSAPGFVLSAGYVAVFLYGGHRVVGGTLTIGTFIAFMAYYMRVFQPVQALMSLYTNLATVQVSLARVHELLDKPPDVVESVNPRRLEQVHGDVEFNDVSIDLGRGEILKAVSFAARAGETVALVGPSGSGKSTVADLMARMLDPDAGTIRLDGIDLRQLSLEDLRRHVVLVDQEPVLFHTSIAENIRYARPDANDDDVLHAASLSGVDEVAARLPDGLGTIVGERGTAMSAGERQRVAIARALLTNPSVLVLDEPTAALDPIVERQVLSGYERAMRGRTTIVITHRLSLASAADRVVVLGDGSIVEQGRPADLQLTGGAFAALFAR
jgi:ATP-binding cassette, subfamily B, bacterial